MSEFIGSWQKIRLLGTGGQGEVWLTRSLAAADRRRDARLDLHRSLKALTRTVYDADQSSEEITRFIDLIRNFSTDDSAADLGAAKVFNSTVRTNDQARRRLEKEIEVLKVLDHPAVIRMLDSDLDSRILVTEYHSGGTLASSGSRFTGDALSSLKAIRGLVEGVGKIHEHGAVHRDIKPTNILVTSDGRLVLADFGIVFLGDSEDARITRTFGERVGPSDWMAPWANTHSRLEAEKVRPTLDLYPLGKVLWFMIAGRALPFWWWNKPDHNLEKLFPQRPEMAFANEIIRMVVVEDEGNCCSDARDLLQAIDQAIHKIQLGASGLQVQGGWPCRVCGVGTYVPTFPQQPGGKIQLWPFEQAENPGHALLHVQPFNCQFCGHTELFQLRNLKLAENAWRG